jgi:hypothetical protein
MRAIGKFDSAELLGWIAAGLRKRAFIAPESKKKEPRKAAGTGAESIAFERPAASER